MCVTASRDCRRCEGCGSNGMDFELAFAMATQPDEVRNEQFLAGWGFDFPSKSVSSTNHGVPAKSEPLPFSIFGDLQPNSSVVGTPGPGFIDADDEFGDFESVPAEGFRGNALSNVGFSVAESTSLTSQGQGSYDIFDFLQTPSNPKSETAGPSVVPDDLFGNFATTQQSSLFSADKSADAWEPGIAQTPEINSDDDWGDFVEHSKSANQETVPAFDWFHSNSQAVSSTEADANGARPGGIYQQSARLAGNGTFGVSLDVFNPLAGATAEEDAAPKSRRKAPEPEPVFFATDDVTNFSKAGDTDIMLDFSERLDAEGLNNRTNGLAPQTTVLDLQRNLSHSKRGSVIENFSTPIPLSLFGEEELENEKSREDIRQKFSGPFQGHSRSKALSSGSLPSDVGNFSNFIASLYEEPQTEKHATDAHTLKESEFLVYGDNTRRDSFRYAPDQVDFANNSSIALHQNAKGGESNDLEEQLFDLKSDLGKPLHFESSHTIANANACEIRGQSILLKEDMMHSGVSADPADNAGSETKVNQSDDDTQAFLSLDYNKLLMQLIGQGRINEASACRAHALLLDQFSFLQEAHSVAVDALDQEKAAVIAREMTEIKAKLAKSDVIRQWQKHDYSVSSTSPTEPFLNRSDTDGLSLVNAISRISFCLTIEDMLEKLGKSCSDTRAIVFEAQFQPDKLLSVAKSDLAAAVDLHSQAVMTFWVLACASVEEQHLFVKAWAAVLTVCAVELERALDLWKQAQHADLHLSLLANLQGKRYFAAIGQIYAVSLIVAAASTLYRPWLTVAAKEGKDLQASLERCKAAWVRTGLKEAVCLALCGLDSLLPSAIVSWKELEGFASNAHAAAMQAARFGGHEISQPVCGLSLLPLFSFSCIPSIEWSGCRYLLPLANIWVNCVSREAPRLPLIELGTIRTT